MAERCPTPAVLEAFASAGLPDEERDHVETHLARCLSCAEGVEFITRAQLAELLGNNHSAPTLTFPPELTLEPIIRKLVESSDAALQPDPDQVLTALDAPTTDGALGAFAGYDILEVAGRGGMGMVFNQCDLRCGDDLHGPGVRSLNDAECPADGD